MILKFVIFYICKYWSWQVLVNMHPVYYSIVYGLRYLRDGVTGLFIQILLDDYYKFCIEMQFLHVTVHALADSWRFLLAWSAISSHNMAELSTEHSQEYRIFKPHMQYFACSRSYFGFYSINNRNSLTLIMRFLSNLRRQFFPFPGRLYKK